MTVVRSLRKAWAAAATLCFLATSCGKAPSRGTIQEPRPAESAESLETKTVDVGFDLTDPITISEPKWSVPIPTGRGGGQIGSSDQGRDSGDTSCHRTRARLL